MDVKNSRCGGQNVESGLIYGWLKGMRRYDILTVCNSEENITVS